MLDLGALHNVRLLERLDRLRQLIDLLLLEEHLQVRGPDGLDRGHIGLQQHGLRQQLLRVARPRRHLLDVVVLVEPAAHGDHAGGDRGLGRLLLFEHDSSDGRQLLQAVCELGEVEGAIAVFVEGAQQSLNALGTPGEAFGPQHRAELLRRQLAVLVGVGRMEGRLGVHLLAGARAHCER